MLGKKGFASKHKLSLSHDPFSKVLQKKKNTCLYPIFQYMGRYVQRMPVYTSQDGRNHDRVFDTNENTGKHAIRITPTAKSLKGRSRNVVPSTKACAQQHVVDRSGRCRENFRKSVHSSRTGLRSKEAFIYSIRVIFS